MKMLIVDDSPLITKMYCDYFSSQGYSVEVSDSPFGVTARIAKDNPDVILMDLHLPGLNGRGVLELLKGKGSSGIVVISGDSQEKEMQDVINTGLAHAYFVKGRPMTELSATVAKVLKSAK